MADRGGWGDAVDGIVPILWAVVGSSAAVALSIRADLALIAAGALLALTTFVPSSLGTETAVSR